MQTLQQVNVKEVAREALRALVVRKLEPTPDNYRELFHEIAGVTEEARRSEAELLLAAVAAEFPRTHPDLVRLANGLDKSVERHEWPRTKAVLLEMAGALATSRGSAANWGSAIQKLIRGLDTNHRGCTRAQKKDRLERLLEMPSRDPEQLMERLGTLIRSWSELPADLSTIEVASEEPHAPEHAHAHAHPNSPGNVPAAAAEALSPLAGELIARVLETGVAPQIGHAPDLAAEAARLAGLARRTTDAQALDALARQLSGFLVQVELIGATGTELQAGLLRLLRLIVDNAAELAIDDRWMHGQFAALREVISGPLDLMMVDQAERGLRDAIARQGALRGHLAEAKVAFKSMVSGFIEQLGDFSDSTGDYQGKIQQFSQRVEQVGGVDDLARLLEDVSRETHVVQAATERSRQETVALRQQVEDAETRIRELQEQLVRVSEQVREDQLTGTLNRRGMEAEYDRAVAVVEASDSPMCVALLDIDNFKKLNDSHGHKVGDEALVHLSRVVKDCVRPSDVVCRYGGEEFVVILPGATLDQAVEVMVRVQRALTKRFFLHDNRKMLITFSAGVALREPHESRDSHVHRADEAMYEAKRSGKNRVVAAVSPSAPEAHLAA